MTKFSSQMSWYTQQKFRLWDRWLTGAVMGKSQMKSQNIFMV